MSPKSGLEAPESGLIDASGHQERTPLNNRGSDVLRLLVQGLANKEIAVRINISESLVKNTLQHLSQKTEVRTRSPLVRVAPERYQDLV
jgi:DNA-binding NarL/FixJ family response regulator